ncbi:serine proteinase stubble-like [Littorina saxatilis]|uniref:Peptidase S1 domain-containing protein n=1 Tax=Littorina saxatilis TaxID=31220 RepID=A0AAN9GJD9_9CAEN
MAHSTRHDITRGRDFYPVGPNSTQGGSDSYRTCEWDGSPPLEGHPAGVVYPSQRPTVYDRPTPSPPSGNSDNQAYDNPVFSMSYPVTENTKHQQLLASIRPDRTEKKKMRRRTIVVGVVVFLLVLSIAIALAVYFAGTSKADEDSPELSSACPSNTRKDGDFDGSLKMTVPWDPTLADTSSAAFNGTTFKIVATMNDIYKASNTSKIVKDICVKSLREGSIVVYFLLFLYDSSDLSDPSAVTLLNSAMTRPQILIDAFRYGHSLLISRGDSTPFLNDIDESTYGIEPVSTTTTTISPTPTTATITTIVPSSATTATLSSTDTTISSTSSTTPQTTTTTPETATSTDDQTTGACGVVPPKPSTRIIGGKESMRGAYPWIVLLFINDDYMCGGSIMDTTHIITAAHCLKDISLSQGGDRLVIVAGSHLTNYSSLQHVQNVSVSAFYNHVDYDTDTNFNDISVLLLSRPLTFDSFVTPVCLPNARSRLPPSCTVAGWGSITSPKATYPDELREVTLGTYNSSACRRKFSSFTSLNLAIDYYLSDGVMCAANGTHGGLDSCQGDSGGPLFCPEMDPKTHRERYTQFGVVSWGEGCGEAGKPGFYAYLPYFKTWLDDVAIPALAKK